MSSSNRVTTSSFLRFLSSWIRAPTGINSSADESLETDKCLPRLMQSNVPLALVANYPLSVDPTEGPFEDDPFTLILKKHTQYYDTNLMQ